MPPVNPSAEEFLPPVREEVSALVGTADQDSEADFDDEEDLYSVPSSKICSERAEKSIEFSKTDVDQAEILSRGLKVATDVKETLPGMSGVAPQRRQVGTDKNVPNGAVGFGDYGAKSSKTALEVVKDASTNTSASASEIPMANNQDLEGNLLNLNLGDDEITLADAHRMATSDHVNETVTPDVTEPSVFLFLYAITSFRCRKPTKHTTLIRRLSRRRSPLWKGSCGFIMVRKDFYGYSQDDLEADDTIGLFRMTWTSIVDTGKLGLWS